MAKSTKRRGRPAKVDTIVPEVEETITLQDGDVVETDAVVDEADLTDEEKSGEPINDKLTGLNIDSGILDEFSFIEKEPEVVINTEVIESSERETIPTKKFVKEDIILSEMKEILEMTLDKYASIFNDDYFTKSGCDYKAYGKWQQTYAKMIVDAFDMKNKAILDVGAAFGAISFGFKMAGAIPYAIDVAPLTVNRAFKGVRFLRAMAQDMPCIKDAEIDLVHASYVLNYIPKNDLVAAFKEFKRVLKDGGKVIVIFNNGEDNLSGIEVKHSNETVINAALEAGFTEFDCKQSLRDNDDKDHAFMTNYAWNMLSFY